MIDQLSPSVDASVHSEYSMVERTRLESEYLPLYPALGTTIWSPLAGGVLTGKYLEQDAASGDSRYAKLLSAAKGEGRARDLRRLELAGGGGHSSFSSCSFVCFSVCLFCLST